MSGPVAYQHAMSFDTPKGVVEVMVKEMSTGEIRALMAGEAVMASEPPTALEVALWGMDPLSSQLDMSPEDVYRFTTLPPEQADLLSIRQRAALVEKVRAVNADFFGLVARWPVVVAELLQRAGVPAPEAPSTSSSDPSPA